MTLFAGSSRMLAAGLGAVVVAAGLVVGGGVAAAAPGVAVGGVINSPSTAETTVKFVTPFRADGRVKLPRDWEADTVTLDRMLCGESIVARARGVYSCGGGANYLPACWVDPASRAGDSWRIAYCLRTPGDGEFVPAVVEGKLPKTAKGPAWDPWRIVLDSGVVCDFSAGMPWAEPPDGLDATYWCSDDAVLLAKSGKRTYAKKSGMVRMQKTVSPDGAVQRVHAKRVVYAGAAPKVAKAKKGAACPSPAVLTRALPAGTRLEASASEGIWCARGWAYAATWNGFNVGVGLFKKTSSSWKLRDRSKVCEVPGPVPAALYVACTVN